ncbi:MAG: HAMP domain-containing histidine kinase [Anaerolineaceae bacterium]|nr:HAMP domain-containing histidine kinase [Anaerolineaceae bacterium]
MNTLDLHSPNTPEIEHFREALELLAEGQFDVKIPEPIDKSLDPLGEAVEKLANSLKVHSQELKKFNELAAQINSGLWIDEILDKMFDDFTNFIPYDRIGFSLLEEGGTVLRADWAKAKYDEIFLPVGYAAPIAGSSLEPILESQTPRIINDLEAYLHQKPDSESTQLIVREGVRSSLTCPLIANNQPVGFIFFSSREKGTYLPRHVDTFRQIAAQLSMSLEKGRLVRRLNEQMRQIEKSYEEVRRLNELQKTFMGIAAHDLRNPIASIQSIADLLLIPEFNLSETEETEFLEDIRAQTRHMLQLLEDLLDITRIESGKFTLEIHALETRKMLEDAVKRHNLLAQPKGTRVVLESVDSGLIETDPERMRQVLDNLISNAVKYAPPESIVRVRALKSEEYWRVEVIDQGPGIKEEERSRLFQDFGRLSSRPTGGERSTGLGLSITRRVIEAHGGQIGVESSVGSGSTFWFTVPVIQP